MIKRLMFLLVSFLATNTIFAQSSPRLEAELQYGLYERMIYSNDPNASAEDRATIALAYFQLGNRDSAQKIAYSSVPQPRALICLAKCYASAEITDSVCVYLEKYLGQPDKMPKAEILLDTTFAKMEKETCWKALWKQEWYPQATAEDEFTLLINSERYNQVLDDLERMGTKAEKYQYFRAKALNGIGQEKDALKILRNARSARELALRWELEDKAGRNKAANQTSEQHLTKCGNCYSGMKMRAISAFKTGDRETAEKYIAKYLAVYYMDAEALNLKATMEFDKGRYLDALETSNQSLLFAPNYAPTVLLRGDIFCKVNNWEHAANMYQQYLDWKGNSADVYYKLGIALLNAGKKQQACREMEFAKHFGSVPAVEFYRQHCLR